jgi:hypothetical protein
MGCAGIPQTKSLAVSNNIDLRIYPLSAIPLSLFNIR